MTRLPFLPLAALVAAVGVAAPAGAATVVGVADPDRRDPTIMTIAGQAPSPARRTPPAGAPYGLHFGPTGLCSIGLGFDWSQVPAGDMVFFETSRVLAVKGTFDAETLVEVVQDDQGTTTAFDDDVIVRVTSFGFGVDEEAEQTFPLWDTSGGGEIDAKSTSNTPQSLYLKRIELHAAPDEFATAVVNDTRIPMHAEGWFDDIETGHDGFQGGGGPDCVGGSLLNDEIDGGAGDDWIQSKSGDDLVRGQDGNDTVEAGSGNDQLEGGEGADRLEGQSNDDCLLGGHEGLRDVYEDSGNFDFDVYVIEPGVLGGVEVDNIEHVDDGGSLGLGCL